MNSTFSLSYRDETLAGPIHDTRLSRTVSVQYGYLVNTTTTGQPKGGL